MKYFRLWQLAFLGLCLLSTIACGEPVAMDLSDNEQAHEPTQQDLEELKGFSVLYKKMKALYDKALAGLSEAKSLSQGEKDGLYEYLEECEIPIPTASARRLLQDYDNQCESIYNRLCAYHYGLQVMAYCSKALDAIDAQDDNLTAKEEKEWNENVYYGTEKGVSHKAAYLLRCKCNEALRKIRGYPFDTEKEKREAEKELKTQRELVKQLQEIQTKIMEKNGTGTS